MHLLSRRSCAVLVLGVLLAGCSEPPAGDAAREKVYKVTGKITMAGSPVADAVVSFSPKAQRQPAALGRTGADGQYTLKTYDEGDGAAAGDYVVLVTKLSAPTGGSPAGAHDAKATSYPAVGAGHAGAPSDAGSSIPAKYSRTDQSDLTATVKAGGPNEFNFDLKP